MKFQNVDQIKKSDEIFFIRFFIVVNVKNM